MARRERARPLNSSPGRRRIEVAVNTGSGAVTLGDGAESGVQREREREKASGMGEEVKRRGGEPGGGNEARHSWMSSAECSFPFRFFFFFFSFL